MKVDRLRENDYLTLEAPGLPPITVKVVYLRRGKVGIGTEAPPEVRITRHDERPGLTPRPSTN